MSGRTVPGHEESARPGSPGWRDRIRRKTNLMLVLASFGIGLAGFSGYLSGDFLHVHGIIFDPEVYANLARDFYGNLGNVGLYRIQRILPSAVVYHVFRLFHISPTDSHIVLAFIILNALAVTLTGYLFTLIADRLALSTRGKWLGFIGLFLNFAILKHQVYSPILTDTVAYAVGMSLLYFYLSRNRIGLYVSTMMGAFVWPTILLQGALLLIFFRREATGDGASDEPSTLRKRAVVISLLIAFFALLLILYLDHIGFAVGIPLFRPAFYLSLAVVVLYLFWGMKTLLSTGELLSVNRMFSWLVNLRTILSLVPVLLLIVLIKLSQHALTSPQGFDFTFTNYLFVTFWLSILYPGISFVSHVIFFGPIVILLLFLWPDVCRLINRYGPGLSLCAMCCLILSLDSESRHMINFMPMFVVFLAKASDSLRWDWKQYSFLAVLSLLMSKVWLTIGPVKMGGDPTTVLLANQRLFMYVGSMSFQNYVINGSVVLLAGIVIYYLCIRNRSAVEIRRPA